MLWVFEPASGSVIAKHTFLVPSAMPGSHSSFWAREPCAVSSEPAIAGEMTSMNSGQP